MSNNMAVTIIIQNQEQNNACKEVLKSAFKKFQVESFEMNVSFICHCKMLLTKPYIMLNKIPESAQFEFLKSNSNSIFFKFFGLNGQFDSTSGNL